MIKNRIVKAVALFCLLATASTVQVIADQTIRGGQWEIVFHQDTRTVDYVYNGETVLAGVFVKTKSEKTLYQSIEYPVVNFSTQKVSDVFGDGEKHIITYSGLERKPDIEQIFYFYTDKDYFLTEARMVSPVTRSCNYIAPVVTNTRSSFLASDEGNRVLSVPFDNDAWICYYAYPLAKDSISFEVTSVYSSKNRKGLVLGSVDHDKWKTGIRYSVKENQYVDRLECFAGVTHALTRDKRVHGSLSGKEIGSPRIMVGMFDDWRKGMETYGDANALVAPPRPWSKGNIFGWNSWGALATNLNYDAAMDISDYVYNRLQPNSFQDEDGVAYIILDSYWDNLSSYQIGQFVKQCKKNNQIPGIYWAPFTHWGDDPDEFVLDGLNYRYKDAYLYVNGSVCTLSPKNKAMDPTHPATKARMKQQMEQYKKWGFKYVKIDYIVNASVEADSYFDKEVTTGIQAYNQGMKYLSDVCGEDVFIALSIAPTFPHQYGNSKRISCDAWGKLADSKYVLNGLSFGWWLDRVYNFNDPDHLTLYKDKNNKQSSEGEARIRATSGVITGTYIIGDNLSVKGSTPGEQAARDRTEKIATNPLINEIARIGRSFYPVEGDNVFEKRGDEPEEFFMLETSDYLYLAVFNYSGSAQSGEMELSRLGISVSNVMEVKELWSQKNVELAGNKLPYTVPKTDVRVYRLEKKDKTGISETVSDRPDSLSGYIHSQTLILDSAETLESLRIYSLAGVLLKDIPVGGTNHCEISVDAFPDGILIVRVSTTLSGDKYLKVVK